MPKVSVIITTYNDAHYIPEALAHLEKQTFQDFEIIIVNDGSTDEASLALLATIKGGRIKVLHKENGRPASARNHGVAQSTAPYILFHDADDYFDPSFLSKAVKLMDNSASETVAITCYVQAFGERKYQWRPKGGTVENFLFKNECSGNCLVRKSAYVTCGGSDETMLHGDEDWELWINMLKAGGRIETIKEFLFFYRIQSTSRSATTALKNKEDIFRYILRKHADLYFNYLPKYYASYDVNRLSTIPIMRLLKLVYKKILKYNLYETFLYKSCYSDT